MTYTVDEIASKLHIHKPAAIGLVRFLVACGYVRFRGERPSKRGKGAHVYEIVSGCNKNIAAMIKTLED